MKTFSTSGTGSQQTLSEIESDKIPIYDSLTDVTSDLANLSVGQIVATKDTGSELSAPVDTVQSGNMHAVTSNAVAESLSYSTTEQKTGGTWIDGKPIYRKVVDCGKMPNIGSANIPHNISNLGFVIKAMLKAKEPTGVYLDAGYGGTKVEVYTTNTNIVISDTYDYSTYDSYTILEYTKTID